MPRRSMTTRLTAATVASLLCAIGGTGCRYTAEPVFPRDIGTVEVPIFQNKSFYRGAEFDLTEALVKEIERRTPYKVVQSHGDSLLTGEVISVKARRLSRSRHAGFLQQMEIAVTVNYTWQDLRSGKKLTDRQGFTRAARYAPASPVGEQFATGQHQAAQSLARAMVDSMGGTW